MLRESATPPTSYHGTTQEQRRSAVLLPEYVDVDERTLADLLAYAASLAEQIPYVDENGESEDPESGEAYNWRVFFDQDVSVFLAGLMATDIFEPDEIVQSALLKIHQLKSPQDQVNNLKLLIDTMLELTELLSGWYVKAGRLRAWNEKHRIEQEIERAFLGDLGNQFWVLYAIARRLQELEIFKQQNEANASLNWDERFGKIKLGLYQDMKVEIDKMQRTKTGDYSAPWGKRMERKIRSVFEPNEEKSLDDFIKESGANLHEYYRLLYATLAYIMEIAPLLFKASIEDKQDHQPDMGLFISFLKVFEHAQQALNKFTRKHLDYYYDSILGRRMRGGVADRAIINIVLNEGVEEYWLPKGSQLGAGINDEGLVSYYETERDLLVNRAQVVDLRSIYVSKNALVKTGSSYQLVTAIYDAPVANSSDGRGQPFEGSDHSWPLLGEDQFDLSPSDQRMERSELGFVIASSTLLLGEGERRIEVLIEFTAASFSTLKLLLNDLAKNAKDQANVSDIFDRVFKHPFKLFLTGEEGWLPISKYIVSARGIEDNESPALGIELVLPPSFPAIVGNQPELHSGKFPSQHPMLKIALDDSGAIYGYSFLRDLEITEIVLTVRVSGLRNLIAYNDQSLLDASTTFAPFGPTPARNSYLLFGHAELFNKEVTKLDINLDWANLPEEEGGFKTYYKAYEKEIDNDSFKVRLSGLSDYYFRPKLPENQDEFTLFDVDEAGQLERRKSLKLDRSQLIRMGIQPIYGLTQIEEFSNSCRLGYFKLMISGPSMGFGHTAYQRVFAKAMSKQLQPRPFSLLVGQNGEPPELELPNLPYAPLLHQISIDYTAETVLNLRQTERKDNNFAKDDAFFRLHPFGQQIVFNRDVSVPPFLLPRFDLDGYLLIGIKDLSPPQTLSLFFDIQDSSKKLHRSLVNIQWAFLQDDEWTPFEADQIISDTTYDLSTRGVVSLHCKSNMTLGNRTLDGHCHWIRVAASGDLSVIGRCRVIASQSVTVRWINNGDEAHLTSPPASRERISGFAKDIPEVLGINQLSEFWGGKPPESRTEFYVRGSERLRHKNRGVSRWDFERIVLEKFPDIHQVKCIGRHGQEDLLRSGEILVVVIPAFTQDNLTPTVGYHVLQEIEFHLNKLTSSFAQVKVINPTYEHVKISCKIKLNRASERLQGRSWAELHEALKLLICPWLNSGALQLGGNISKNDVLSMIAENEHVEFVTAFSLVQIFELANDYYKIYDTAASSEEMEIIEATTPWSVLVPVPEHQIKFIDVDEYTYPRPAAIDDGMRLETDFIVTNISGPADEEFNEVRPRSAPSPEVADEDFTIPPSWLSE